MKNKESSALFTKEAFINENLTISEISEDAQRITDNCDIGSDEEAWLLWCPKTINVKALVNQRIKLPGKMRHERIESVAKAFPSVQNLTMGVRSDSGYGIKSVPIYGEVSIREHSDIDDMRETAIQSALDSTEIRPDRFPIPGISKVRHPLFGADYEDKIALKPAVAARLRDANKAIAKLKKQESRKLTAVIQPIGSNATATRKIKLELVEKHQQPVEVKKEKVNKRKDDESTAEDSYHHRRREIKEEKPAVTARLGEANEAIAKPEKQKSRKSTAGTQSNGSNATATRKIKLEADEKLQHPVEVKREKLSKRKHDESTTEDSCRHQSKKIKKEETADLENSDLQWIKQF